MRRGSKQRRAKRVKRRRKQLAALVGVGVAHSILCGNITVYEGVVGLDTASSGRALELVEQLQQEAGR